MRGEDKGIGIAGLKPLEHVTTSFITAGIFIYVGTDDYELPEKNNEIM